MEDIKVIDSPLVEERLRTLSFRQKVQLLYGKALRFYYGHFRKAHVERSLALRQGECKRCGACCNLLVECAFAKDCDGNAGCRIYAKRPVNCRIFPMDARDLTDRDLMLPSRSCGFSFAPNSKTSPKKR